MNDWLVVFWQIYYLSSLIPRFIYKQHIIGYKTHVSGWFLYKLMKLRRIASLICRNIWIQLLYSSNNQKYMWLILYIPFILFTQLNIADEILEWLNKYPYQLMLEVEHNHTYQLMCKMINYLYKTYTPEIEEVTSLSHNLRFIEH